MRKHGAILFGYVLMSNHFHLLVGLCGGGPELSVFMRDIKSMSWRTMFRRCPGIWIPRFDDVAIYTDEQFQIKLNYIHNNPVKAELVDRPQDYPFSSARIWLAGKSDDLVTTELEL